MVAFGFLSDSQIIPLNQMTLFVCWFSLFLSYSICLGIFPILIYNKVQRDVSEGGAATKCRNVHITLLSARPRGREVTKMSLSK